MYHSRGSARPLVVLLNRNVQCFRDGLVFEALNTFASLVWLGQAAAERKREQLEARREQLEGERGARL